MIEARTTYGPGKILLCLLVLLLSLLAGCSGGGSEVGNPDMDMRLASYMQTQYASTLVSADTWSLAIDGSAEDTTPETPGVSQEVKVGDGFSGTNVQVEGVDEADKVKTDGDTIYLIEATSVALVRTAADGEMSLASRVGIDGTPTGLHLYGDILAVSYRPATVRGSYWGDVQPAVPEFKVGTPYWLPVEVKTGLLLLDVSDPKAPVELADWRLDGNLISSRRIGADLHLVLQYLPDLPPLETVYDGSDAGRQAAIAANQAKLSDLGLDDFLPHYQQLSPAGLVEQSGRLVASDDFYTPPQPQGGSIVSLVSFDLDQPRSKFRSLGAILDAHHLYASTEALYLASSSWNQSGPGPVPLANGAVNSQEQTTVTKIRFGSRAEVVGSATLPGWVDSQFSFGEDRGVLRVVTTTGSGWEGDWRNHVFCLRESEEGFEQAGELLNLAPGERLYASRFLAERGYLVTFLQIDPLLVLDLADPTRPQLVGELKVPGYSEYIHPLDADHLLTLGKDAAIKDGIAYYQGLQLSVFDVSDPTRPQLQQQEQIGDRGSDSEALSDHRALSFWNEQSLLALPVDLYQHPESPTEIWSYAEPVFRGLYFYRVTPEAGFESLGRIATAARIDYAPAFWSRGLFIGTQAYAVTPDQIQSRPWSEPEGMVRSLPLQAQ